MTASICKPLVAGYWSCLTLKCLSNQLNSVFLNHSFTPSLSGGADTSVLSQLGRKVSPTLQMLAKQFTEFLGAVESTVHC